MRIRQIVKKINQSLIENPTDWHNGFYNKPNLINTRGIDLFSDWCLVRDPWRKTSQPFYFNDAEYDYIADNFYKLVQSPDKRKLKKINKRRAWLIKEVLKTL